MEYQPRILSVHAINVLDGLANGSVGTANFDADVAAAVDSLLNASHGCRLQADGGTLSGRNFLIMRQRQRQRQLRRRLGLRDRHHGLHWHDFGRPIRLAGRRYRSGLTSSVAQNCVLAAENAAEWPAIARGWGRLNGGRGRDGRLTRRLRFGRLGLDQRGARSGRHCSGRLGIHT